MSSGMIDTGRIEAMVAQLKAAAQVPRMGSNPILPDKSAAKVDFPAMLKSSLDQVNNIQQQARELGQSFAIGDNSVSLPEVMVSMQKASIAFQQTVQVRNKLVSAYQEIMNMPV